MIRLALDLFTLFIVTMAVLWVGTAIYDWVSRSNRKENDDASDRQDVHHRGPH